MLVTNKDLLAVAKKNGYAIPALNVMNLETVQAVVEAATQESSPLIIQISPITIKYAGLNYISTLAHTAAMAAQVPISIHLDHGESYQTVANCINAGFSSVMIDGSSSSFEENVALTRQIVTFAHTKGIPVEAELGRLDERNVAEEEAVYTDPGKAEEFVKATGIDSLAIAIGTSHGAYKLASQPASQPSLDFERLRMICNIVNIPLVLHGASSIPSQILEKAAKYGMLLKDAKGIPDNQLTKAIELGITKINVDTDVRLAFIVAVKEAMAVHPNEFDLRKILGPAMEAVKDIAISRMRLFGSKGKASCYR
jgi:fructose-bisphosphate aldolase class II